MKKSSDSLKVVIVSLFLSPALWAGSLFFSALIGWGAGASEASSKGGETRNKRVIYRKSQDVEFDGSPVDGVVRNPDGAYLSQRRGINFSPLYNLREQFDKNIHDSVEHLR